jgi:hypothetical protein
MTTFNPEEPKSYPWQRIDRLLKLLDLYYPNIYMPFYLALKDIQFKWVNDISGEIQLPEQLLPNKPKKLIVDLVQEGEAKFKDSEIWQNVVAFAEYMHSNETDYIDRLDLVHSLYHYKYDWDEVIPMVVYTGHKKCRLAKTLKSQFRKFRCLLMDVTRLQPHITMEHPLFPIKFMTIFSHRLSNRQIADFFIREFEKLRNTVDEVEFYRFAILIQLACTPRNAMAVKEIHQYLFEKKPAAFYHEILKGTPLYEDLMRMFEEEKKQEKAEAAEQVRQARAEAEAKAQIAAEQARAEAETKAQIAAEQARAEAETKARISSALRIVQDYGLSVAQVAQTLGLTYDEIKAVEAALKA